MNNASGFIDFAAVKAAVSLEMILEHYGVLAELRRHGENSLRGCCPIHKGNDPKQFAVTLAKNAWNCFSECKRGGNQLDFVSLMENCKLTEAAWKVNGWFDLGLSSKVEQKASAPRGDRKKPKEKKNSPDGGESQSPSPSPPASSMLASKCEEETGINPPLSFSLQNLDSSHPYLAERGLNEATIQEFGLGFCSRGILAGRIAIPIMNSDGQLVGNAGRWPGTPPADKEKYRLPGGFKKSLELFNVHRAKNEQPDTPLVIVEGYFGAIHLWQHGIRRVVALMGSSLSVRQEEMVAQLVTPRDRILLMLDNDNAGSEARMKIAARLFERCFVGSFVYPTDVRQPDQLTAGQFAALDL